MRAGENRALQRMGDGDRRPGRAFRRVRLGL